MTPVNNSYLQTSTSAEQASLTVLTPQQEVANAFAFKKYQTIHEARPFEVARFLESFQRADADSDGFVTQKELNDHVVRFGPQPGSGDISKIKLNEEFVLPARLMKENFATLASSAKGVSRSDLLNAAAKGGSKDRLDQGDGLKLPERIRAEYHSEDSFQKFIETLDKAEQANLYPTLWNTGAAYTPSHVRNEVSQHQLRQFLALPANEPGVSAQDRRRAQFMLDNFGELSGGDGWLSRSDLAQKSDGGDHDLLLNATDLAASASAAKTPDTQYVARKSTKEVAQDAAEAGKESSSKASAPNAKAPDMWREWLNRFFQLLFAMW